MPQTSPILNIEESGCMWLQYSIRTLEIVGVSILTTHQTQLVINALASAVLHRAPPRIIHSDQGSEYCSKDYTALTQKLGIKQSMSAPRSFPSNQSSHRKGALHFE
ncbi:MAG: transposase family protein [Candidatus Nomurabacteria bacterium]|nr:MAG: transposase family protein [Candidatus Nomurabacteria bacterium]